MSEHLAPKLYVPQVVKIDSLRPADWNVNQMSDVQFNNLVKSIQEDGFREPIHVVPISVEGDQMIYRIIGGHHRVEAARICGLTEVTAIVFDAEEFTEDVQKLHSVKLNMIKGKISQQKFTKLFLDLKGKYPEELLHELMAFESQEHMKKFVKEVGKALPEDMRDKFKKSSKEIQTVDDLATVINGIFNEHGHTVAKSFIFFQFGGSTHLMIEMDKKTREALDAVVESCEKCNMDVNEALTILLTEKVDVKTLAERRSSTSSHDHEPEPSTE